jgi:XrtJ-associated TM-motif-TM protein
MKRSMVVLAGCVALLLAAGRAYGQTGCTDSPENPTVVLALVGGAGALSSAIRARMRARRISSQR